MKPTAHALFATLPLFAFLAAAALPACNPSVVKQGDPIYRPEGTTYYLGRPLSGPSFRNANMFGQKPFLDAGTKVRVLSIERAPKVYFSEISSFYSATSRRDLVTAPPVYRVYFDGPEICAHAPCMTNWRMPDDATFEARFAAVFRKENPLETVRPAARALIEKHQVASWFTQEEVMLSFGVPNFIQSYFGLERWLYEDRFCDLTTARYLAVPHEALIFEGGRLVGHEKGHATDFYAVAEPLEPGGLCWRVVEESDSGRLPIAVMPGTGPDIWPDVAREWDIARASAPAWDRNEINRRARELGLVPSGTGAPW